MDWLTKFISQPLRPGQQGENIARKHLLKHGLKLVEKNYTCRYGEIDLIMRHKKTLVFVEVRYRQTTDFGLAQETVNIHKQRKIIKSAQNFLLQKKLSQHCSCRFDIVAIHGTIPDHQINWIKDAFYT